MTCIRCQHTVCVKAGSFGKRHIQRWRCTLRTTNMVRVHSSLRVTPAIEAGIADHVWSLAELLGVQQHAI